MSERLLSFLANSSDLNRVISMATRRGARKRAGSTPAAHDKRRRPQVTEVDRLQLGPNPDTLSATAAFVGNKELHTGPTHTEPSLANFIDFEKLLSESDIPLPSVSHFNQPNLASNLTLNSQAPSTSS